MLRSGRSILALAVSFAFCAQGADISTRPDEYVARAKQFFRRFYPGLDSGLRAVTIDGNRLSNGAASDRTNSFTIELYDLDPKPGTDAAACWCSASVLSATFIFDWQTENKGLIIMSAGGSVVNGRTDRFAKEMNSHPKWSDTQVTAALNDAGAKFGPHHKAEFLRALPIEELKPWVGELEVVSADFSLRDFDEERRPSEVDPYWIVQAKWHGPDGREKGCTLIFEPFDGKLKSIRRDF